MTTEIEKTFFDTFGIEPKKGCTAYDNFTEEEADVICNDRCRACLYFDDVYPRITPEILLELLCLCPDLDTVFFTDIEQLKETLLTSYIKIYKYYTEIERLSDCEKELKHQVRTLFEEG